MGAGARGDRHGDRRPRRGAGSSSVDLSDGDDIGENDGLNRLPAAIELLAGEKPHDSGAGVTVERIDGRFDRYTINWTRLMNPRQASSDITLARIARSMIERDAPVELWDTCHFGSGTWQHVLAALELARDARWPPVAGTSSPGSQPALSHMRFRRRRA